MFCEPIEVGRGRDQWIWTFPPEHYLFATFSSLRRLNELRISKRIHWAVKAMKNPTPNQGGCGWGCPAGFSSRNTSIQDAICGDALPKESDGISKTLSNGLRLLIFFWCCRVCCCRVYTSINQNNTRGIISILVIGPTTYLHQTILPASLCWCFVGMCMN